LAPQVVLVVVLEALQQVWLQRLGVLAPAAAVRGWRAQAHGESMLQVCAASWQLS